MTEGASRWGYDPLFNIESNMGEKQAFVMTKFAQSQARLKNHEIAVHKIAAAESMGAPLITAPVISYQPQPIVNAAPINYQFVEHPEKDIEVNVGHGQPVMMYPAMPHPVLVMPISDTGSLPRAASMMV